MTLDARRSEAAAFVIPSALGLLIAAIDRAAPFGDDSAQFTLLLWLLACGLLGFARPERPWRWAVLVGPWLSLVGLMRHMLGRPGPIHPESYTTPSSWCPSRWSSARRGPTPGPWPGGCSSRRRRRLPPHRATRSAAEHVPPPGVEGSGLLPPPSGMAWRAGRITSPALRSAISRRNRRVRPRPPSS